MIAFANIIGENDPDGFAQTLRLHNALEDRYFVLTGKRLPLKIGPQKMFQRMEKLKALRAQKMIVVEAGSEDVQRHLRNYLTKQGYRTTDRKDHPYDIKLFAKLKVQQLHLNVSQFQKYEFSLQISATDAQEIQKNVLSLKWVQIGRSQSHARELAIKSILLGLEKKIDSLLKEQKT